MSTSTPVCSMSTSTPVSTSMYARIIISTKCDCEDVIVRSREDVIASMCFGLVGVVWLAVLLSLVFGF